MFYVGNEFSIAENKAYKTQTGAEKAAEAANMNVYDDVGNILFPPAEAAQGAETGDCETVSTVESAESEAAETRGENNAKNCHVP